MPLFFASECMRPNSWAHSTSANPQIAQLCQFANPQIFIIKPQISTKYCTTMSQNSPKNRLFIQFLLRTNFNQSIICYSIFVKRKSLYLRTCGSFQFLITKKTGPQIRKMSHFWQKVSKMSHLRKVRKSNQLFKGTIAPDQMGLKVVWLDRP